MILFSDAVFAIAITLLVIEIKVPEIPKELVTDKSVMEALAHLIPKFAGFLISFIIIGQYWIVHHRMFGFVINFTEKLVRLNILFLFAIALMPFSTGFHSEFLIRRVVAPVIFYTANIALLGIVNYFLWRYISRPHHHLSENLSPLMAKYFSLKALAVPVVIIVYSFVYLYAPNIAPWFVLCIPLSVRLVFNPMKKKIIPRSK
jgi:uncharacterized membrane protein